MGNRSNVVILGYADAAPVVLYSHWGGKSFHQRAIDAIREEGHMGVRIGDPSYFTRKMVEMVKDHLSGVGTSLDDNEHKVLVINANTGDHGYHDQDDLVEHFKQRDPSSEFPGWPTE